MRNRLLALAVAAGIGADDVAVAQVLDANMTLSQGALAAVNNRPTAVRETVPTAFMIVGRIIRWFRKWFRLSQCLRSAVGLNDLQLMQHPHLIQNPTNLGGAWRVHVW